MHAQLSLTGPGVGSWRWMNDDPFALFDEPAPASSSEATPSWLTLGSTPPQHTAASPSLGPRFGLLDDDTLHGVLVCLSSASLAAMARCSRALSSHVERAVVPACAALGLRWTPERRAGEGAACVLRRAELRVAANHASTIFAAGHHSGLAIDPHGVVHLLQPDMLELCSWRLPLPRRARAVACGALHALLLLDDGAVLLLETPSERLSAVGLVNEAANEADAQATRLGARWTTFVPPAGCGGEPVASIACGAFHSLIVGVAGTLWSAGRNCNGQCGVGHRRGPVPIGSANSGGAGAGAAAAVELVAALRPARALQASGGGHHSLCLTAQGSVYAWGCNQDGRLGLWANGDDGRDDRPIPCRVELDEAVCAVAAGGDCSLALTERGEVLDLGGSGLWREEGGVEVALHRPLRVRGLPGGLRVTAVSAGFDHCACVDGGGCVWTWGARGAVSRHRFIAPEGYAGPDDAECAARAARRAAASAALDQTGDAYGDATGPTDGGHPRAVALAGGRLEAVGQLGRTGNGAAAAGSDAHVQLPAARAERFGRAIAVAAGGSFTLPWPAEGTPWVSAPTRPALSGAAHDHGSAHQPCGEAMADEIVERLCAIGMRDHDVAGPTRTCSCTPLLYAASPMRDASELLS